MAKDERGDDLFEDLDRFFAPIKDVDWDEPEEADAPAEPREEHVAVRSEPSWADDAGPSARGPAGDALGEEPEAAEDEAAEDEEPEAEDEAAEDEAAEDEEPEAEDEAAEDEEPWYDTQVLETAAAVGSGAEQLPGPPEGSLPEPPPVTHVRIDEDEEPSPEDLEAAAEHFAGSLRDRDEVFEEPAEPTGSLGGFADDERPGAFDDEGVPNGADVSSPRTVVVGAEGLGGPSWQEPAAVEVGADLERRGPDVGERDVPAAFLTGVVLAGIALASLLVGDLAFAIVVSLGVLAAQGELFGAMVKHQMQPATLVGLVTGQLIVWGAYARGEGAIPAMLGLGLAATVLWYMTVPAPQRARLLQGIGATLLNVVWIPALAGYLLAMLDLPDGRELVVAVIGLTFVYDTFAFFVGSVWGGSFTHRSLAPTISPRKSIEGLVGGTAVVVVVSVALVPSGFIGALDGARLEALLLGLVVAAAATLGDLAESLVKRDLGIKDMGSILPGHGGVLDRIDSLLFVAPAAYLLFRVVFVA
ncbi:MAG: hypothetical protein KatS3mg013_0234 [Actinomycetota bacterium]|nr:MAG: hypothetical protein KatS3mg013_0234 [Actinomycetota bacterium]